MLYYDPAHPPAVRRHCGEDSRLPDRALSRSAVLQFVPGQLHADRLRVAFTGQMAAAVHTAAGERHELLSLPLGLESAERICRDRHQGTRGGHRHRVRPVAWRGVRAGAAQRLHAGREGGTRREVRQLSHAHARSRERGEGAGGREGRQDGHVDAHRPLPARHRQSHHRVFAGQELRHAAGRTGPARHAHRRHVVDRRERRPGHARHHVLLQSPSTVGTAAHAGLLLRLPALHAGRRSQLAAIRLLHDAPRAAEADRGDAGHGAHGRPADDRSRARRQPVRLFQRAAGKWRRHHQPDGCLQQQHLARRSDRESGDRQSLAAGRRQSRQRGTRRQRRVPRHGEESR